jgi:hypothetical protein
LDDARSIDKLLPLVVEDGDGLAQRIACEYEWQLQDLAQSVDDVPGKYRRNTRASGFLAMRDAMDSDVVKIEKILVLEIAHRMIG